MYWRLGCLTFTLQLVSDPVAREKTASKSLILNRPVTTVKRYTPMANLLYEISKRVVFRDEKEVAYC